MIGIIAAMEMERDAIRELMTDTNEIILTYHPYYIGTLSGHETVLTMCGIGKVASAIVTSQMIEKFHPELIINVGVAGGLQLYEKTGDVVVADLLTYHDYWVGPVGDKEIRTIADHTYVFYPDEVLSKAAYEILKEKGLRVHMGAIVSGDQFVTERKDVERITSEYPEAIACDMESTSIAHACRMYDTRVLILRTLSDIAVVQGNDVKFNEFAEKASHLAAEFASEFLETI